MPVYCIVSIKCQSTTLISVVRKVNHMAENCSIISGDTFSFSLPMQVHCSLNQFTSNGTSSSSSSCLTHRGQWQREGQRKVKGDGRTGNELERDHERQKRRERLREGGGSCATGHSGSPSPLTSMCHLTVLQIRLHMLPGDVRTYILTVGLNLHRCAVVI